MLILAGAHTNYISCARGESAIPAKYREVIGLAVAADIKCPYRFLMHMTMATGYGARDKEIAEVAVVASYAARWSVMVHALQYNYDTFVKEVHKISEHVKTAEKM